MGYSDMKIDSGKYLKIDNAPVDIHILSKTPVVSLQHGWGEDKLTCAGEDCNACSEGETPKQRFFVNVWDRKDKKVKIYEFGGAVARQIRAIAEMLEEGQQTIHDVDLRIKKDGSDKQTKYTVMNRPLSGEIIPEDVKLYPLP